MFECLKYSLLCDPLNENSLRKIWVCAEMINSFEESIELHKHIINEDPYSYMAWYNRSEEHTSELQSRGHLVCRLLLEKKNTNQKNYTTKAYNTHKDLR